MYPHAISPAPVLGFGLYRFAGLLYSYQNHRKWFQTVTTVYLQGDNRRIESNDAERNRVSITLARKTTYQLDLKSQMFWNSRKHVWTKACLRFPKASRK